MYMKRDSCNAGGGDEGYYYYNYIKKEMSKSAISDQPATIKVGSDKPTESSPCMSALY